MDVINLETTLQHYSERINTVLNHFLPATTVEPQQLHTAMRYAVLNGGKRIRPLLVYAASEIFNSRDKNLLDCAAAAIEFIHCYSLVHDDLPAMDNDDFRRGKPSCHKAFDEATAILVGDALQALAFKVLSDANDSLPILQILTEAIGSRGLVGGQSLDLQALGKKDLPLAKLEMMHRMKTGALIRASVLIGATISCENNDSLKNISAFADNLGLAFQIQDDILDATEHDANKPTFVSLLGLNEAKKYLNKIYHNALSYLNEYAERADTLRMLADFIVHREL